MRPLKRAMNVGRVSIVNSKCFLFTLHSDTYRNELYLILSQFPSTLFLTCFQLYPLTNIFYKCLSTEVIRQSQSVWFEIGTLTSRDPVSTYEDIPIWISFTLYFILPYKDLLSSFVPPQNGRVKSQRTQRQCLVARPYY